MIPWRGPGRVLRVLCVLGEGGRGGRGLSTPRRPLCGRGASEHQIKINPPRPALRRPRVMKRHDVCFLPARLARLAHVGVLGAGRGGRPDRCGDRADSPVGSACSPCLRPPGGGPPPWTTFIQTRQSWSGRRAGRHATCLFGPSACPSGVAARRTAGPARHLTAGSITGTRVHRRDIARRPHSLSAARRRKMVFA